MDIREKLVELIFDSLCRHIDKSCKLAENIADDLISNGVTVQEWISVKDRLPEDEGWYLVYTTPNRGYKSINKAMFCKVGAGDNFETYWRGTGGHWENITHWMPLPNPPKGEERKDGDCNV